MGISENRGPKYSTLNSIILIIRTPNIYIYKVPLIFGNSHMWRALLSFLGTLRTAYGLNATR